MSFRSRLISGFTLIEILVVMVIIGIGLFSVAPILGERAAKGDEQLAFFNDLLKEHYALAKEQGAPVSILGFKGSANIVKYDGSRVTIPGIKSVQSAWVNEQNTPGVEYSITVFPEGLCDYFVIETDNHLRIESLPLLMTISRKKI